MNSPSWVRYADRIDELLISAEGGCLEWSRATNEHGYGVVNLGPRTILVHRHRWTLAHGPIPAGLEVCHHCDNPPCANVDHLFIGTRADNMRDCASKGRNFAPDNRGERAPRHKLTAAQALAIRESPEPVTVQAARLCVTVRTVYNVLERKTWRHI